MISPRASFSKVKAYSYARDSHTSGIFLDANENSLGPCVGTKFCRYPGIKQKHLRKLFAEFRQTSQNNIFLGCGSDEIIDLLIRIFCEPGRDSILICPPTYGMYEVFASINDVDVQRVNLTDSFDLNVAAIENVLNKENNVKIIFFCSPGNPTGKLLNRIENILEITRMKALVVVDEAYIDFSGSSLVNMISTFSHLVVIQTMSKSFGLAGIRIGASFSSPDIVSFLELIRAPYSLSECSVEIAIAALSPQSIEKMIQNVALLKEEAKWLLFNLIQTFGFKIRGGLDGNFLLLEVPESTIAEELYDYLAFPKDPNSEAIVVRLRSTEIKCKNCLRISIGTREENKYLLERLSLYFLAK
jgi:histidinol-phosphate aminotransferase